jgi:Family of unknown function (DUF6588)
MKKYLVTFAAFVFISCRLYPQVSDSFSQINPDNLNAFAKPLATSLGTALNSAGYNTANISSFFSFSFSLKGMYIIIPNDQKTFVPNLPNNYASEPTATVYGDKGAAYPGPNGYITMPGGFNLSSIPAGIPQISASFMGTEIMLRYLPSINVGSNNQLNMFGIGISHEVSQYIPLLPVDVAVQLLYNKISVTNVIDCKTLAFNAHASKTFGVVTPYIGLQYENSSFTASYTTKADPNSGDPYLREAHTVSVNIDGDDTFRATVGVSFQLALIVLNADYSVTSQPVVTAGLTFEF